MAVTKEVPISSLTKESFMDTASRVAETGSILTEEIGKATDVNEKTLKH